VRDPLKGWTREDAALADPFSIEQSAVGGAGFGLEFGQVVQATLTAQVMGVVDDGLDAQRPAVCRVAPDDRSSGAPSEPYVPLIAAYGSSKPRGRAG
jgi:hypothetical protein